MRLSFFATKPAGDVAAVARPHLHLEDERLGDRAEAFENLI